MAVRKSTYETLCKRLGELDKERREILKQLRNSPEFIVKFLNDKLVGITTSSNWYIRKGTTQGDTYFKLVGFVIHPKTLSLTDKGSALVDVKLSWEVYSSTSLEKTKVDESVNVSAFNEIDNQILNGRVLAPKFSEKMIQKNILTEQKKALEEQLKNIKKQLLAV
jgi:hypothetical protein